MRIGPDLLPTVRGRIELGLSSADRYRSSGRLQSRSRGGYRLARRLSTCAAIVPRNPHPIPAEVRRTPASQRIRGKEQQRATGPLTATQLVTVRPSKQRDSRPSDFGEECYPRAVPPTPVRGMGSRPPAGVDGPFEFEVLCARPARRVQCPECRDRGRRALQGGGEQ